jgi:hypothetical protein
VHRFVGAIPFLTNISEIDLADEIDLANEQAERWLNQALTQMVANGSRLTPRGTCFYCETEFDTSDATAEKRLFCDLDCSKDYEEEQRLKNRR